MADLDKMDRTWLCSVLFMDIVNYSSQSVELQMKWKRRFNGYLAEAIQSVPESERVILDTGDGAAICFLGAPEAAMFAALQLCSSFVADEREQPPGLCVRLGINLGPVKLIKDVNGAPNAIGDGINAGQRIMSFASANRILVSQSFFEVVSRLSDDYKRLFQLKGIETDKHVREHTVYHLMPPGSPKPEAPTVDSAAPQTASAVASPVYGSRRSRAALWLATGGALVLLAAAGIWRFSGPAVRTAAISSATVTPTQTSAPAPPAATDPPPQPRAVSPTEKPPSTAETVVRTATSAVTPPSGEAKAAFDEASALLEQHKPAEAARRFTEALRASPDYVDAYVGRAQARRLLDRYELSLEDCNKVIQISPSDARGFNCRGYGHELLQQYQPALRDFNEAIRLNPDFAQAYADRGGAYSGLQQYERAIKDYSEAIRLRPRNEVFYQKRGAAYSNLRQYDKATQDYTAAIRVQPNDLKAYGLRADVEDLTGDAAGAAADRRHVRESRAKK